MVKGKRSPLRRRDQGQLRFLRRLHGVERRSQQAQRRRPDLAVFDQASVEREQWITKPPYVDLTGWFFQGDTLKELAGRVAGPYQKRKMDPAVLESTVAKFNAGIDAGKDEFGARRSTSRSTSRPSSRRGRPPILHDTLSGLHTNTNGQVMDRKAQVIPGLYCAGESMAASRSRSGALRHLRPRRRAACLEGQCVGGEKKDPPP